MNRIFLPIVRAGGVLDRVWPLSQLVPAGNTFRRLNMNAQITTKDFKLHKLDEGPPTVSHVTREEALDYYHKAQTIRQLETTVFSMYKANEIHGRAVHLYIGQEACAVGIDAILTPDDAVITSYRAHGWTFIRGVSIHRILAEILGKKTGCSKGKGGSMHMYGKNFYGGMGIVGTQVPLGAGISWAQQYFGNENVCVTVYGDGAANQGQVHEAFNMAKIWNLPCIFVCENNKYGKGTSSSRVSASTKFYTRGDYIPGVWVDGMDVFAVKEATRYAKDFCVSGKGPIILELDTYRFGGHITSDDCSSYRSKEELERWRLEEDPITRLKDNIFTHELATETELKEIDLSISSAVEEAYAKAKSDPPPDDFQRFTDIYANTPGLKVKGTDSFSFYTSP